MPTKCRKVLALTRQTFSTDVGFCLYSETEIMNRIHYILILSFSIGMTGCALNPASRYRRTGDTSGLRQSARRLASSGDRGVPVLLRAARDSDPVIREIAAQSLLLACWQSPPSAEVAQQLIAFLNDPSVPVQEAALSSVYIHFSNNNALNRSNRAAVTATMEALDNVISEIVSLFASGPPRIARASAKALSGMALGDTGDQRVMDSLAAGLQSEDLVILFASAHGLSRAPPNTVFEPLFNAYAFHQPPDPRVHEYMIEGIWRQTGRHPEIVYQRLEGEDVTQRRAAAMFLGDLMSLRSPTGIFGQRYRQETIRILEERLRIEDDSRVHEAIIDSIDRIRAAEHLDRTSPLR